MPSTGIRVFLKHPEAALRQPIKQQHHEPASGACHLDIYGRRARRDRGPE